jgi:hypothetical protein
MGWHWFTLRARSIAYAAVLVVASLVSMPNVGWARVSFQTQFRTDNLLKAGGALSAEMEAAYLQVCITPADLAAFERRILRISNEIGSMLRLTDIDSPYEEELHLVNGGFFWISPHLRLDNMLSDLWKLAAALKQHLCEDSMRWSGGGGDGQLVAFVGGGAAVNWSRVSWTETSRATGIQTFQATDSGTGASGRLEVGWWKQAGLTPAEYNQLRVMLGLKAQADLGSSLVSHRFPLGSVIESRADRIFSLLAMAGLAGPQGTMFYGIAGLSIAEQRLHVFLGGPDTSEYRGATGFTGGLGAQFASPIAGLSFSAEWQHTFWSLTHLDGSAASPNFNYAFRRDTDTFAITGRFSFGDPPKLDRVEAPTYPVKAPRLN